MWNFKMHQYAYNRIHNTSTDRWTCWKNIGESQTIQVNSFLKGTETLWSPLLNRWEHQALMMSWWVQCHMAIEICPWHFTNISITCWCQALRESVRDKNTKTIYSPKHIHAYLSLGPVLLSLGQTHCSARHENLQKDCGHHQFPRALLSTSFLPFYLSPWTCLSFCELAALPEVEGHLVAARWNSLMCQNRCVHREEQVDWIWTVECWFSSVRMKTVCQGT